MRFLFSFLTFLLLVNTLSAQSKLQSGPMLGYVEMREALIWVQTTEAAMVSVKFWDSTDVATARFTDVVLTKKEDGYTAKCIAELLEPGRTYCYQVIINNEAVNLDFPTYFRTQKLWQWREDPPTFSVAFGSCSYINEAEYDRPNKPYGSEYEIFESIAKKQPAMMIWGGDNVYLREADWFSRSGTIHRYTHTRSTPEMKQLLANSINLATWDDHDFGPNNSDRNWTNKEMSWEVFKAFWGNPTFGLDGQKGVTTFFQLNDMEFYLMDNRYFRTANDCKTCDCIHLGKEQVDWLVESMTSSYAPFKFVVTGGQVLNTAKNHETYINLCETERQNLLDRIEAEGIPGVFFLTGDRHFTEFSSLKNGADYMLHDLTISSLTAGSYKNPKETNENRVEGTLVDEHNFGLLTFSGKRTEREVKIEVFDKDGELLWTKTIKAERKRRD